MPKARITRGREQEDPVVRIERAMVRIRRSQTRRTPGRRATADSELDFRLFDVVDAVEEGPTGARDVVTIGEVAKRLAVDPSRASRVVSEALAKGYIKRIASQADARRVGLVLTASGRKLARGAQRFRVSAFKSILESWAHQDVLRFAELLTKFTAGVARDGRLNTSR